MRRLSGKEARWAAELFGDADLGDSRRTARLINIATRAAQKPAGKISDVFDIPAEQQGAYDFLESRHLDVESLLPTLAAKTMRLGAAQPFVFVSVDGSSLKLTDRRAAKGFGSIGSLERGGRGLKVITALGLEPTGVPLGLCDQRWWARTEAKSLSAKDKKKRNRKRKAEQKETRFWLQAIDHASAHARAANRSVWFLLDREADNTDILLGLLDSGQHFTVRASSNRLLDSLGHDKQYLRSWLGTQAPGGRYRLEVAAGPQRQARRATMVVRWACVTLCLRDRWRKRQRLMQLHVVWSREQGTTPAGEKPLDWMLLTDMPVGDFADAQYIIYGYTLRWRVEDFHKTWKSGACQVEHSQLRSLRAVTMWATILATVAVRVERLKHLARSCPELPADVELSRHEIKALILFKRDIKKRNEVIPETTPSIGQATVWIAQLGGYTGKSSGGPPGSITIRRGRERLRPAARLLQLLEQEPR